MKVQHWRAFSGIFGLGASPMLDFFFVRAQQSVYDARRAPIDLQ
jgi:hypothetical protein